MNESHIKERYMEYQFLMQQLQQLQENVSALEKHIGDLNSLNVNLTGIKQSKVNSEVLMPLGSGIFLKGELKDNSSVIMNVGNGICVDKTLEEAKDTVSKQLEEVTLVLEQLRDETTDTMEKLTVLQEEFQKFENEKD